METFYGLKSYSVAVDVANSAGWETNSVNLD